MKKNNKISTKLTHYGLNPNENHGIPNPPIYKASTILYESMAHHRKEIQSKYTYGRRGTPTSNAFEKSIANLYSGEDCISTPSGLSAITTAILSVLKNGDHALFPDNIYGSSRIFILEHLTKFNIEIEFYEPRINKNIENLIRKNTKLIYIESPGSLTFELTDIKTITKIAKNYSITTIVDNTWGTFLHQPVLQMGVDIVVEAGTKYICGHSDTNLGIAVANKNFDSSLRKTRDTLGICAGPDELYTGLRGLRTLRMRLKLSEKNGFILANHLVNSKNVIEVLHPGLTDSKDFKIYENHFSGSCGLFGFIINPKIKQKSLDNAVENMHLFKIGASWGGFESLIIQSDLNNGFRQFLPNIKKGHLMRIYAGFEDIEDLKNDLSEMLNKLEFN